MRVPVDVMAWEAAGLAPLITDTHVSVRLRDGGQCHLEIRRDGGVDLLTERSSSHREIANMLGVTGPDLPDWMTPQ
jgi:hypothetical protein